MVRSESGVFARGLQAVLWRSCLVGVICSFALGTSLRGQTGNQTAEIVARQKEIKDDPNMSAVTRDSAKKLLDEIGKNESRIRWDGPEGPPIARTTPDEPGRPPAVKDKFKKKWGKKQLIVISRNWRRQLED